MLLEAARRLDPPRLRRAVAHLRLVADPDGADAQAERRHQQRGLWLAPTWEGMVAVNGLLDPEAGQTLLAALEPLARPTNADDSRTGGQRRADALAELARRSLESGPAPPGRRGAAPAAGDRGPGQPARPPQPGLGGEIGGPWPLDPEACRRLACDGAVTRVLVTRQPLVTAGQRRATTTDHDPGERWQPGGPAAGGGDPAPPGPWWCPHPAAGGRPDQPGRHPRPTGRPGGPRRRLRGGRLRPAPGLVRGPPSPTLAPWRPHRPREPGVAVPSPPSRGP